jgi:hypothetical protein
MEYMLLIYNDSEALAAMPESEMREIMDTVDAVMSDLQESGEFVRGEALAVPSQAVRAPPPT